jgi:dATP pyrophosphohydrolase
MLAPMNAASGGKPYKIPESVLVVIHTPALAVLLIERADRPGSWQSVTGSRADAQEALDDTAIREVAEETGLRIGSPEVPRERLVDWQLRNRYEIYPVWRHRYAPGITHNTEAVYGLCLDAPCTVQLNPREHVAQQWLPWREAADRCFSWANAEAILQLPRFAAAARPPA